MNIEFKLPIKLAENLKKKFFIELIRNRRDNKRIKYICTSATKMQKMCLKIFCKHNEQKSFTEAEFQEHLKGKNEFTRMQ